jgi:hypothetical protein
MVFVAVYMFKFVTCTVEYFCCTTYLFATYANVSHILFYSHSFHYFHFFIFIRIIIKSESFVIYVYIHYILIKLCDSAFTQAH